MGIDNPTFLDNPVEYCKRIYKKYEKHNEGQRTRVVENRKFYEGYDEDLEARKANAKVVRSAQFIPEYRPAQDSVVAALVDSLLEQNSPVKLTPTRNSTDDPDHINKVEEWLNEELRDTGVLVAKTAEVLDGGGTMPIVAVKNGWEEEEGWIYKKTPGPAMLTAQLLYLMKIRREPPAPMQRVWGVKKKSPYTEVLDYDEFLYDHTADSLDSSECVIHRKWVTIEQIESMAPYADFDLKEIAKLKEEWAQIEEDASGSGEKEQIRDEVAKDLEDRKESYKDGKALLCEFWVDTTDQQGRDERRIFVLAANRFKMSKGKYGVRSEWDKTKYPFVGFRFNKQFNRMEGTPPIEIAKPMQKVLNDCVNAYLDYLTYNVFPVLMREPGTNILSKPTFGPGEVWDVSNPDGLNVLHVPAGDINTLLPFAQMIETKIRQITNASDTAQGIPGAEQEKATKTIERSKGRATRSRMPAKATGDFIIEIAKQYIYMHQAMGEVDWLIDVNVDVPSLTGAKSPEEEREEAVFLLTQAMQNPVYTQTPTGLLKLRRLTEEVYLKFRKRDIDKILPTETEMKIVDEAGAMIEDSGNKIDQNDSGGEPSGEVVDTGSEQEETTNASI